MMQKDSYSSEPSSAFVPPDALPSSRDGGLREPVAVLERAEEIEEMARNHPRSLESSVSSVRPNEAPIAEVDDVSIVEDRMLRKEKAEGPSSSSRSNEQGTTDGEVTTSKGLSYRRRKRRRRSSMAAEDPSPSLEGEPDAKSQQPTGGRIILRFVKPPGAACHSVVIIETDASKSSPSEESSKNCRGERKSHDKLQSTSPDNQEDLPEEGESVVSTGGLGQSPIEDRDDQSGMVDEHPRQHLDEIGLSTAVVCNIRGEIGCCDDSSLMEEGNAVDDEGTTARFSEPGSCLGAPFTPLPSAVVVARKQTTSYNSSTDAVIQLPIRSPDDACERPVLATAAAKKMERFLTYLKPVIDPSDADASAGDSLVTPRRQPQLREYAEYHRISTGSAPDFCPTPFEDGNLKLDCDLSVDSGCQPSPMSTQQFLEPGLFCDSSLPTHSGTPKVPLQQRCSSHSPAVVSYVQSNHKGKSRGRLDADLVHLGPEPCQIRSDKNSAEGDPSLFRARRNRSSKKADELSEAELRDVNNPVLQKLRTKQGFKSSNDWVRGLLRYFFEDPVSDYAAENLTFLSNPTQSEDELECIFSFSSCYSFLLAQVGSLVDASNKRNRLASSSSSNWWASFSELFAYHLKKHEQDLYGARNKLWLSNRWDEREKLASEVEAKTKLLVFEDKRLRKSAMDQTFKTLYFVEEEFPSGPPHLWLPCAHFRESVRIRDLLSVVYPRFYHYPSATRYRIIRSNFIV